MMRWLLVLSLMFITPAAAHAAEVQEVVSSGGIKAWLVEEHSQPLLAINITFTGAGYAYDPEGLEGRANMVSGLLMEGAGSRDSKAFNEAVESHALRINTGVQEELLHVTMEAMSDQLQSGFALLGDMLVSPRFDEEAITRIQSQMQTALREQEQNPGFLMQRALSQLAYGKHPYAKQQVGTQAGISSLSQTSLREFSQRYLTRGNMLVAVVGDITPQALASLLDSHFAALPASYQPDQSIEPVAVSPQAESQTIAFDIPQTMIGFATQGFARNDPDYMAAYVLNQILGGGDLGSRLNLVLREQNGLTYGAFSALDPMPKGATWGGHFATRNEQAGKALSVLHQALAQFASQGPTDAELADAKRFLTGSFVLKLDSNKELANFLITMQYQQLGIDYLKRRNSLVEAVTKQDMLRVAQRLIKADALKLVMVGKPQLEAK